MLPIILGVVGAGFLVSAYSEKKEKKFAKGGRLELGKIGKLKDSIPTSDKKSMVEIYEYEDKYILAVRRDGWEANFIEKVYPTYEAAYKAAGVKANSFAKGGSIPNNYEGKTPEQVWNEWSVEQKKHFLKDHLVLSGKVEDARASQYRFDELPKDLLSKIKEKLEHHISEGQYAKGGNVNTGKSWHLDRAKHNKKEKWEKPMAKRKRKYAKGGNVYSSEEPYIVKVYSHSNELLDQKTIRAKSNKEANEMAEDMEDAFKKKFGNDLRIKVVEAQKMAKGGSMAKETMKKEVKKSSGAKKSNPQTGKLKEVMAHAKATRKAGEAWKSAVARAWKEVK